MRNNWDGVAIEKYNRWVKKIKYYIKVNVEEGKIIPSEVPGEEGRDIYYFPGDSPFDLEEDADGYEISEFDGTMPIVERLSDELAEQIEDFLSVFTRTEDSTDD